MKTYNVYPNFRFQVRAEDTDEATDKAYELLKEMQDIIDFDFDFEIEEEDDELDDITEEEEEEY